MSAGQYDTQYCIQSPEYINTPKLFKVGQVDLADIEEFES